MSRLRAGIAWLALSAGAVVMLGMMEIARRVAEREDEEAGRARPAPR
jgi:hypothetical protein